MTDAIMTESMRQQAPYPNVLAGLVERLRYKAGWRFRLADINRGQGCGGLTLIITITGPDSYDTRREISVDHYMPVPPAAYDERSWRRWLFEQVLLVERHEAMEFFRFPVGPKYDAVTNAHYAQPDERPYAPSHGPGNDPYLIREIGTDLDRRTAFTGEVHPT